MLLPDAKPCALQIVSAAVRQSGAPLGAVGQIARSLITREPGQRDTASAVSRVAAPAASAASLAAPAAPLRPEFQVLTESSMKCPRASMNPAFWPGAGGDAVPSGCSCDGCAAGGGDSGGAGDGVCAATPATSSITAAAAQPMRKASRPSAVARRVIIPPRKSRPPQAAAAAQPSPRHGEIMIRNYDSWTRAERAGRQNR